MWSPRLCVSLLRVLMEQEDQVRDPTIILSAQPVRRKACCKWSMSSLCWTLESRSLKPFLDLYRRMKICLFNIKKENDFFFLILFKKKKEPKYPKHERCHLVLVICSQSLPGNTPTPVYNRKNLKKYNILIFQTTLIAYATFVLSVEFYLFDPYPTRQH